jgi:hypothetical protein
VLWASSLDTLDHKKDGFTVLFYCGKLPANVGWPKLAAWCVLLMLDNGGIYMKYLWMGLISWGVMAMPIFAQEPIYRCGNEYTNTKPDARAKGCKLVEGGNVTVVQGTRVPKAMTNKVSSSANGVPTSVGQVDAGQQKARDSDASLILQEELKKAQARQENLKKEYNNGEPEKRGDETRNHQKYLDRVAELKAHLARNEVDMAGIRRELERLPAKSNPTSAQ